MDVEQVLAAFAKKGYKTAHFADGAAAAAYLNEQIDGRTVAFGDSRTLYNMGVYDLLASHNQVVDPMHPQPGQDFFEVLPLTTEGEVFLTSVNAATVNGELVNIDAIGNRVAGTLYGHGKVYFVFSTNKLCEDLEQAGTEVTRRGYPWGMVTNGMALTPQRLDRLMQAGLRSISISLDGFEREHNHIRGNALSYERALRAIRRIVREPNLTYDVITCATGALIPHLEEFRDLLIAEGVRHWRIFSIFPMGRARNDASLYLSDEQFRSLLEFIRRTRREGRIDVSYACEGFLGGYEAEVRDNFYQCAAGISVASIRVDGSISGCTSIRGNFHQGNIYRDDFWEVWEHRFEPFRNREWARQGECANCKMFRYCLGGGMHLHDDDGQLLYCHYRKL